MAKIKRIFITGAPGSMWSGVDRWLRFSFDPHIDNSDITPERDWRGHEGAYWNPGNEPGYDWILNFDKYTREEIIQMLDSAYTDQPNDHEEYIIRTYKSHYWCFYYDQIREMFPEADIISVYAEPHKAWIWWRECGGHDTVFDGYHYYQRDYNAIWNEINNQTNATLRNFEKYGITQELFNFDFIRKYYSEPSIIAKIRVDESFGHPDGIDSLLGVTANGTGLADTTRVGIHLGTPRQF
jgi:hypothetical protein